MNSVNFEDYGQTLRELLLHCGIATIDTIEGCWKYELEVVKHRQNVDFLPQIYREFLLAVGKRAGRLFQDTTYSYYELLTLKQDTNDELQRLGYHFRIPLDAFIFLNDGGYALFYFHTFDRNDDPPVFKYSEGEETERRYSEHLSQFLEESVREYAPDCL